MSNTKDFWKSESLHSRVKSEIAVEYFAKWAQIMKGQGRVLTYLDLCSGRGKYEDEGPSTPIRILNTIGRDPELLERVHLHFYEKNKNTFEILDATVKAHPEYSRLKTSPKLIAKEVGPKLLGELPLGQRTFCLIDPYGYTGITPQLLSAVLNNWGSDCLFFISISGIGRNLGAGNYKSLQAVFGDVELEYLKVKFREEGASGNFHKNAIAALEMAIRENSPGQPIYFLPFAMEVEERGCVSHYLVFLSKEARAFSYMKPIMARRSNKDSDGIPLYW